MQIDSAGKICPFCPENKMVEIIDDNEVAYLVQVRDNARVVAGRYLVIPKVHIESYFELPDTYLKHERELVQLASLLVTDGDPALRIKLNADPLSCMNISWNQGFHAGQRVKHMHAWVIFRSDGLAIGTNGLIEQAVTLHTEVSESEGERSRLLDQLNRLQQSTRVHH